MEGKHIKTEKLKKIKNRKQSKTLHLIPLLQATPKKNATLQTSWKRLKTNVSDLERTNKKTSIFFFYEAGKFRWRTPLLKWFDWRKFSACLEFFWKLANNKRRVENFQRGPYGTFIELSIGTDLRYWRQLYYDSHWRWTLRWSYGNGRNGRRRSWISSCPAFYELTTVWDTNIGR